VAPRVTLPLRSPTETAGAARSAGGAHAARWGPVRVPSHMLAGPPAAPVGQQPRFEKGSRRGQQ
jgi:hypothetical protein